MLHRTIGAVALGAALGLAPAAFAASTRTHVSNAGSDANTAFSCDYAHPCRTFAAALTETTPGGEILAIDSSGYGKVTIDRSVSIIAAPGAFAGIGVGSGNGVTIATAGVKVVLRGLSITGQGGSHGIYMTGGTSLTVENCVVANMGGNGLRVNTSATVRVLDSLFQGMGSNGATFIGAKATISGSRFLGNLKGIEVSASSGETATATIERSLVSGSAEHGVEAYASGTGTTLVAVKDTVLSGNGFVGLVANAAGGTVEINASQTTASGNGQEGFYAFAVPGLARMDIMHSASTGNSRGVYSQAAGGGAARVSVSESLVSGNATAGLRAYGTGARLVARGNTVTRNASGFEQLSSAVLESDGSNAVLYNAVDASGTITAFTRM